MKTLTFIFIILVGIQFIPFDIPAEVPTKAEDEISISDEKIQAILKRSCFDCHSNHTTFPWYSNIAPVSWFTKYHVKEGREKMNFSTWSSYDDEKKRKYLEKIPRAVQKKMPLPSYLLIHKEAVLSDEEKVALKNWADEAAFDLE